MNEFTVIETVCPVCPVCGRPVYADSDWSLHEKAKKNLVAIHTICKDLLA